MSIEQGIKMKLIFNSDSGNVAAELARYSNQSDKIEIVVPFFTSDQVVTKWIENGKDVSMVISLRFPTNPVSIRNIFSSVELKFNKSNLHSKIYFFSKDGIAVGAILGSSNFTGGGLDKNVEANIYINDPVLLKRLKKEIQEINEDSFSLEPADLKAYEIHYKTQKKLHEDLDKDDEKYKSRRKSIKSKNIKPSIEARRYLDLWKFSDEICSLVDPLAKKTWPNVPLYLVVDHFWHWIVTEWGGRDKSPKFRDGEWRKRNVPLLFRQYIQYDLNGARHTQGILNRLKIFHKYLSKNNINKLTITQAKEFYRAMNCGYMRVQRFEGDKVLAGNKISKIRNSLYYLLYSPDDIEIRIHKLISRKSDFKLRGFSDSAVQEILGWVHCDEMPIRNDKANKAVKLLGFKFS